MQIIFLPKWALILSFFIVWPLLQLVITLICNMIDLNKFNPNIFFLKSHNWEKGGAIYKTVFKIHRWKHLLPDGAKTHKTGFQKKNIKNFKKEYLNEFIYQTGRAEIAHWIQIMPFFVFGFWSPNFVIWIMLLYAILVNMPCIIAQRYNRPRLIKIYERKKTKKEVEN